jgi:D-serine deaminase-like pyridoxal phosphate-dependent protein
MAGLGVCALHDIALSVLISVIGHQEDKGWVITDGGWMSLAGDRGTASQPTDQGYGVVCGIDGQVLCDLIVVAANQEHGIITSRPGMEKLDISRFPIGTNLRVLPNHACATAAQHDRYLVVGDDKTRVVAEWPRLNGW